MKPLHLLLPLILLVSACVYRQDIPQGNFFKPEDVARLEPGMTREQVQFVMGTPMISDPFHPDRWDYVFYNDSQTEARNVRQRVTVFFDGERLERIEKEGIEEEQLPVGDEDIAVEGDEVVPVEPMEDVDQ